MCRPLEIPYLKSFVVDGVVYDTTSAVLGVYKDHLWCSQTHDTNASFIPRPQTDPQREQLPYPQQIEDGEVRRLINKLKIDKAGGIDGVTKRFLKLTQDIIIRYLEHLFRAYIELSYEPDPYKLTKTVILRKPGRPTYIPSSWRPIALLSSIGKLLEAIVAHRLRDLNVKYNILPKTQFGVAGRCTTRALQKLLDSVYIAWCQNLLATLLSLDIKGAFDRVDRKKLLDVMIAKGLPDWIIRFVWSFLSNRKTLLEMPGHKLEDAFYVNIGIPQGSPLSPILFLLFASSMLECLAESMSKDADDVALAYIDDTYLLVVSDNYERICQKLGMYFWSMFSSFTFLLGASRHIARLSLHIRHVSQPNLYWRRNILIPNLPSEQLHARIMVWATDNGVTFEPSKYAIIHFQDPLKRRVKEPSRLPNIVGLDRDSVKNSLRILGIMVDHQLKWQSHVAHVSSTTKQTLNVVD